MCELDFLDGNFVAGCFDGVYEICDREFVSVAILEGWMANVVEVVGENEGVYEELFVCSIC